MGLPKRKGAMQESEPSRGSFGPTKKGKDDEIQEVNEGSEDGDPKVTPEEANDGEEREQPVKPGKALRSSVDPTSLSFFKMGTRMLNAGKTATKNLTSHLVKGVDSGKGKGKKSGHGEAYVVASSWKKPTNAIEKAQAGSKLYDGKVASTHSLRKRGNPEDGGKPSRSLGKGWFDVAPAEMTSELKNDMKVVQMRNYLDPKRFYKNPDKMKSVIGVGTVIEGPEEFTTQRLTRKERERTLVGEILADSQIKDYTKRKYAEIQQDKERNSRKKKKKLGQRAGVGSGSRKVRKLY